jgi:hypothetical protein
VNGDFLEVDNLYLSKRPENVGHKLLIRSIDMEFPPPINVNGKDLDDVRKMSGPLGKFQIDSEFLMKKYAEFDAPTTCVLCKS